MQLYENKEDKKIDEEAFVTCVYQVEKYAVHFCCVA